MYKNLKEDVVFLYKELNAINYNLYISNNTNLDL